MNRQNFYNNIENSGARVIGEYINSSTPVECICQNGHSCNPRPNPYANSKERRRL